MAAHQTHRPRQFRQASPRGRWASSRPRLLAGCVGLVTGALACAASPQAVDPTPDLVPPMALHTLPPGFELEPLPAVPEEVPPPSDGLGPGEYLAYLPVPAQMHELLDRLSGQFDGSPDFGSPEISLDRTRVVVRWHGGPPATLQHLLDEYSDAPFDVVLEPTDYATGELRAEAQRLVRDHAPIVKAAGARISGDGVDVLVSTEAVDAAGSAEAALEAHDIDSDYPLYLEVGGVVPA